MYPLIEIKTVPIEIQMKIQHASLEYSRGTAEMEISHNEGGGLDIKSRPIRLRLDTFEANSSLRPTTTQSVEQSARQGTQAAYEATAAYAQQGKLMLNAKLGQNVTAQIAQQLTQKDVKTNIGLDFIPKTGPDIDWEEGDLEIRYDMDKLNFDWKINQTEFKFTPGDIEISMEQRPDVVVKYVGGAIYVPPSSDPNYQPVDVKA